MIEWLTSEAGMTALSVVGGFWMRHQAEKRKEVAAIHKRSIEALSARDQSMNQAAERTKDGGTWMRRAFFGLIAFMFVAIVVAGFVHTPVVHEITDNKSALWGFLKKTVTTFVTTEGVFLPPEIRQAFLMLVGFYVGQGVK